MAFRSCLISLFTYKFNLPFLFLLFVDVAELFVIFQVWFVESLILFNDHPFLVFPVHKILMRSVIEISSQQLDCDGDCWGNKNKISQPTDPVQKGGRDRKHVHCLQCVFSNLTKQSILTLSPWRQHEIPQVKDSVRQVFLHFRCLSKVQVVTSASERLAINQKFP